MSIYTHLYIFYSNSDVNDFFTKKLKNPVRAECEAIAASQNALWNFCSVFRMPWASIYFDCKRTITSALRGVYNRIYFWTERSIYDVIKAKYDLIWKWNLLTNADCFIKSTIERSVGSSVKIHLFELRPASNFLLQQCNNQNRIKKTKWAYQPGGSSRSSDFFIILINKIEIQWFVFPAEIRG